MDLRSTLARHPHSWASGPADGQPLHPVAYSVGGYRGPILPGGGRSDASAGVIAKLGEHGAAVGTSYGDLPQIEHSSEYDWAARQEEERRERECFALDSEDGRYTVSLRRVVYVKRFVREGRVGFTSA